MNKSPKIIEINTDEYVYIHNIHTTPTAPHLAYNILTEGKGLKVLTEQFRNLQRDMQDAKYKIDWKQFTTTTYNNYTYIKIN